MDMIKIDIRNESKQIRRIFEDVDLVSVEDLLSKIEELEDELGDWKMKYEELEEDMHENYRPVPFDPYKEYGVSERDFH